MADYHSYQLQEIHQQAILRVTVFLQCCQAYFQLLYQEMIDAKNKNISLELNCLTYNSKTFQNKDAFKILIQYI